MVDQLNALEAIPSFIFHISRSTKEGMRSAAAQCCRNLYFQHPQSQTFFIERGGGEALLSFLQHTRENDFVVETLYNVEDLLVVQGGGEGDDGGVNQGVARSLERMGFVQYCDRVLRNAQGLYQEETLQVAAEIKEILESGR